MDELPIENQNDLFIDEEGVPVRFASIDKLRFILMIFICIDIYGLPFAIGKYLQILSGIATPIFFMLSGFLVLRPAPDRSKRILRAIGRTALCFGVLIIVYAAANYGYYLITGDNVFSAFKSSKVWIDFLALNKWPLPIGVSIWYVQALLYAYIIIFVLEKLHLLKFDWIIMIIIFAFAIYSGELSSLVKFNLFGYTNFGGNYFTRAIPYILLGCFIARNLNFFCRFSPAFYISGIAVGIVLSFLEMSILLNAGLLNYYGHFFGMIIASACITLITVLMPDRGFINEFFDFFSVFATKGIYYIFPIVSAGITLLFGYLKVDNAGFLSGMVGILTYIVSEFIVMLFAYIIYSVQMRKLNREFEMAMEAEEMSEMDGENEDF